MKILIDSYTGIGPKDVRCENKRRVACTVCLLDEKWKLQFVD